MNYKEILKSPKRRRRILLLTILIIAFILRLYYFNMTVEQTAWWDEADYMSYAKRIGANVEVNDIWYYRRTFLLPLVWGGMFKLGFGEASIRFTEILFSLGLITFCYLVGKEMFSDTVGLVSAAVIAFSRLPLFLGTRFLTAIPALFFYLIGVWLFWKGYVKKQNNKFIVASGIFFGLAIFTRFAMLLSLIPIGAYVFFNEKGKFWKNKHVLIALLIVFLVLTPYLVRYQQHYGGVGDFIKHYTGAGKTEQESKPSFMGIAGIPRYLKSISLNIGGLFSIFVLIGLYLFLNLLYIDKIFSNKEVRKALFLAIWIAVPLIFHGMFSELVQERYLLWAYPAVLMLGGLGVEKTYKFFKEKGTDLGKIAIAGLVLLLLFNAYGQVKMGDELIKSKVTSYGPVRESGLWIKANSEPGDVVMSNSVPQTQYYTEREVYMPANASHLESYKPKYIITSMFERSAEWYYQYPNKKQLKVVNIWFMDAEQKQPSLIIYELS